MLAVDVRTGNCIVKKWLAAVVILLVVFAGYIAAGPFLTIHAIREAVQAQDAAELSRHIDFPALRASFRQQLDDYLVRTLRSLQPPS